MTLPRSRSNAVLDALIVSNTTITRPPLQVAAMQVKAGACPAHRFVPCAPKRLIDFRKATGGKVRLIGVGGIASAEDAYARIRAGASLVQIYSALVYEGPFLAEKITRGLEALLDRDGFASITEAIGIDVD
jgi:dihydroorotate dehydrogenase